MIEEIKHQQRLLALIVRRNFQKDGIHFFTPDDFSQQLAYMHHPAGKVIQPHIHRPVPRNVTYTQEVLLLKRGKLRVDFYDDDKNYISSRILEGGDMILLSTGGHGVEVLEEIEMIEVKQGPYAGNEDKLRFDGVKANQVKVEHG